MWAGRHFCMNEKEKNGKVTRDMVVTWDGIDIAWDKKWAITKDKEGENNWQSKSQQKV